MPLVPGDRVTTLGGRVEILFPDASALDLDRDSTVDLLTPIRLSLSAGRAIFVVPSDISRQYATRYEIDTPVSTIVTSGFGTYRADATSASGTWPTDAFDQWAEARYAERSSATSGQYLPQDLRVYSSTFDRYGSWQYDTSYGYVWYPGVAPAWRPYYNGFWEPIPRYGWTWVGTDIWAWPTHHYGRWGYSRTGWYWIPGRTFGPAWVSWGAADGFVSWCPLGFDNRPVLALSVGSGFPSSGWVVVPRTTFGARRSFVNRYAVAPHRIPAHTAFIVQTVPPVAVPRDVARRATLAGPVGASGGARASRTDPRATAPASIGRAQSMPPATAVPRSGITSRSVPENPQPRVVSPQQPIVTQPRQAAPAIRGPDGGDRSRIRETDPSALGSTPDRRSGTSAVPRALPPAPAVGSRVQPQTPPAATNGAPRSGPPPGHAPAQVAPPPQRAPVSTPPPVAVPHAAPPAASPPAAAPPAPAPPATGHPSHPSPSRSGGGEGHAGESHAQGRRRG